jgi:hypothetical protein
VAEETEKIEVLTPEMRAKFAPELKAMQDDAFAKGRTEGATAERERIKAVESHSMVGHEALITEMKFDGKTTGPEAAVRVLNAHKEKNASKLADIRRDAPVAVAAQATEGEKTDAGKKPDANELAREAKAYHTQQAAAGNPISMIEATEFVYKRAGVPTK